MGPNVFDQLEDAKRDVQLPEYLANSRFHKVGAFITAMVACSCNVAIKGTCAA